MVFRSPSKKVKRILDGLFIAALLVFVFNTGAKVWVMQRLLSIGLFKAEIKQDNINKASFSELSSFTLKDINGHTIRAEQLKNKVVFINYWASWCPPCRAEMPALQALYERFRYDDRFVFLFINEDDDNRKMLAFLKDHEISLPVYTTAYSMPSSLFSGTLPTSVIINKDGQIVFRHEGLANYTNESFQAQLKGLAQMK